MLLLNHGIGQRDLSNQVEDGEMKKNSFELSITFKKVFAVLDYCYQLTNNDWLGAVLGQLDWTLWEDGMPADMATYEEFMEIVDTINDNDIRILALGFVEEYYKRYTIFDINSAVSILKTLSEIKINELISSVE